MVTRTDAKDFFVSTYSIKRASSMESTDNDNYHMSPTDH
jgi:hypothetical protein